MKTHDTPPAYPARWPYIAYDDDACDLVRVPTPGELQDAMEPTEELTGAARLEAQLGAVVLLAWRSRLHALEGETPREVYRELHDAGWTMDRIASLASFVTDAFKASTTTEEDVKEAEAF